MTRIVLHRKMERVYEADVSALELNTRTENELHKNRAFYFIVMANTERVYLKRLCILNTSVATGDTCPDLF